MDRKLKSEDFAQQTEDLLRQLLGHVPFIKIKSVRPQREESEPDLTVKMTAGGRPWRLAIECKSNAQPREVRTTLLQLKDYLERTTDTRSYGIMIAPFLSPESARLCEEANIGYADLAGNARLSFDQVFIELRAAENPFRVKRGLRSLFSAKAGRILRVLLTPPLRAWKVIELESAAGVSLGQVSNVRKLLLDGEWAGATDAGLKVSRPEELLRAWGDSYKPRFRSRETAYTLLHGERLEEALRAAFVEAGRGKHAVLASYSAARWLAPYVRQATQYLYADSSGAEILRRHLQLQSVSGGENVVLLEPQEDDVFTGRVEAAPGIWCSGLVQTWLDLGSAGERGGEAAELLLREKLTPGWQEISS